MPKPRPKPKRYEWRIKQKPPEQATSSSAPPPPPSPPWVELPREITADILRRVGPVDTLVNAQNVCRTWWEVCHDPSMWRVIEMSNAENMDLDIVFHKSCRVAVDRSKGQLTKIDIEYFGNDNLLEYIAPRFRRLTGFRRLQINVDDQAHAIAVNMPELRHLALFGNIMTNEGLCAILDGCPHLESLDLRHCYSIDLEGDLGTRCRQQIIDLKCPNDCTDGYEFSAQICDCHPANAESDLDLSDDYDYDDYDYDYHDFEYDDYFNNPFGIEYLDLDEDGLFW